MNEEKKGIMNVVLKLVEHAAGSPRVEVAESFGVPVAKNAASDAVVAAVNIGVERIADEKGREGDEDHPKRLVLDTAKDEDNDADNWIDTVALMGRKMPLPLQRESDAATLWAVAAFGRRQAPSYPDFLATVM